MVAIVDHRLKREPNDIPFSPRQGSTALFHQVSGLQACAPGIVHASQGVVKHDSPLLLSMRHSHRVCTAAVRENTHITIMKSGSESSQNA